MLIVKNTIIQNMIGNDIYAYATKIYSFNCVLGDCGRAALALDFGGNYEFDQLTIGNYWSSSVRLDSALYISNYSYNTSGKVYNALTKATFGNIILYGAQDDELSLQGDASHVAFNFMFDHCLLKTHKNITDATHYNTCLVNKDPGFLNVLTYDYQIDSISPAIKQGSTFLVVPSQYDIKGNFRGSPPDLGAYQYVPN
jgi:hypothetical protein